MLHYYTRHSAAACSSMHTQRVLLFTHQIIWILHEMHHLQHFSVMLRGTPSTDSTQHIHNITHQSIKTILSTYLAWKMFCDIFTAAEVHSQQFIN